MVETPRGMLAIHLGFIRMGGIDATMTLYGADGWNADQRTWMEHYPDPERPENESLAQFISEWTGMPPGDAEVFVEETVSRWRRSSAYERDVQIGRWSSQLMLAVAVVCLLALFGVAALVWLVVSALT
jgi:hypothetical protein